MSELGRRATVPHPLEEPKLRRRFGMLDWVLILTLVPLWLVCFSLHVREGLRADFAYNPLEVSSARGTDYPIITWLASSADPRFSIGDRVIRVGPEGLQGITSIGFHARVFANVNEQLRVPIEFEHNGVRGEAILQQTSYPKPWWALVPFSIGCVAVGLIIFVRAPRRYSVRYLFVVAILWSIWISPFWSAGRWQTYVSGVLTCIIGSTAIALTLQLARVFPGKLEAKHGWEGALPWLLGIGFSLYMATGYWFPYTWKIETLSAWAEVLVLSVGVSILWLASRQYRCADSIGQRQLRWIIFSLYIGIVPILLVRSLDFARLLPSAWSNLSYASAGIVTLVIPLSFLIAIQKYGFFDIDRLISTTASYNILLVLLIGGGLLVVPPTAEAAAEFFGIAPTASQIGFTLLLATVLVPAHRRLRPQIERVFFAERYALDQGIAELLDDLSTCDGAEALIRLVGGRLHGLLRPDSCVLYAVGARDYSPVFIEGHMVPPAFDVASPLAATLSMRSAALCLSNAGRRPDQAPLSAFDRAALETLQAEVVVPVRRHGSLLAFLCLGPKRSGDVYTSIDLTLLSVLAEAVSNQLSRFDQEQVIRQSEDMQESLRRYVPNAVARRIAQGEPMEAGTREVSVLFADIVGSTEYAEARRAEEVFSVVNSHIDAISNVITRHGGMVTEFLGDGVMAVFGAPDDMAHKERGAIEAGCELISMMDSGHGDLELRVGIATGDVFVGNIQMGGQAVWTALGDTANLAARLEGLTREFGAMLVIDSATWKAAGKETNGFFWHEDVPIRGRVQKQDVYSLGLAGLARPS